jgi:L-asparaginase II
MSQPTAQRSPPQGALPDIPALVRVWRGDWVESQHRGLWALVDSSGRVIDSAGDVQTPIFARSSLKSLQALPLLESGAAERFGLSDPEVVLAISSHSGEACHTRPVAALLQRLRLSHADLRCGAQPPAASLKRARCVFSCRTSKL